MTAPVRVKTPEGWKPLGGGDGGASEWVRPADWLPMNVDVGEQKVQVLVAVGASLAPETSRVAVFRCTGAFTVDWGDGTAPTNYATNAVATHLYDPASLSGTLTADGWLQARATITPQSGQTLSTVDTAYTYYTGKITRNNVVEVVVGHSLTSLGFGSSQAGLLHRVEFKSPMQSTSPSGLFNGCTMLREVIGTIESTSNTATNMFNGCVLLTKFPTLSMPNLAQVGNMFSDCASMTETMIPEFPASQVTSWGNTFSGCVSLRRLPAWLNVSAATYAYGMFTGCVRLEEADVPTPLSTTTAYMFERCQALRRVTVDTSSVTTIAYMFNGCGVLETITNLDVSKVTASSGFSSSFYACNRLRTLEFRAGAEPRFTFSLLSTSFDAAGLNGIYTALPTVTGQTLTVTSVPGGVGDDPSIATAKGWTVTGS